MMKQFDSNASKLDLKTWLALHEVSHIFQEGGDMFLHLGVISSPDTLEQIRAYTEVFEHAP